MTPKLIARLEWADKPQQRIVLAGLRYLREMDMGLDNRLSFLSFMERYVDYTEIPSYVAHGYADYEKALWFFDRILKTHGIEYIRLSEYDRHYSYQAYNGHYAYHADVTAYYCNAGETYTPTLVYRRDIVKRWDIISVGDLVETLERKGYKLA